MTQQAVTLLCPLVSISGITGDVGKSLAVGSRMIDLFAKWLASEVATLAGGYWSLWGRHQLLTATDKLSLPLGIHMSTMVGNGAEVWPKMLRAVMTLKHHESVSAVLAPDQLLFFDMMEVEKVPALVRKWTWISYMTGEKSVREPPMITTQKWLFQCSFIVRLRQRHQEIIQYFFITLSVWVSSHLMYLKQRWIQATFSGCPHALLIYFQQSVMHQNLCMSHMTMRQ